MYLFYKRYRISKLLIWMNFVSWIEMYLKWKFRWWNGHSKAYALSGHYFILSWHHPSGSGGTAANWMRRKNLSLFAILRHWFVMRGDRDHNSGTISPRNSRPAGGITSSRWTCHSAGGNSGTTSRRNSRPAGGIMSIRRTCQSACGEWVQIFIRNLHSLLQISGL